MAVSAGLGRENPGAEYLKNIVEENDFKGIIFSTAENKNLLVDSA